MNLATKVGALALVAFTTAVTTGCAMDTAEADSEDGSTEGEEVAEDDGLGTAEAALTSAGTIRVAQVNPFFAG